MCGVLHFKCKLDAVYLCFLMQRIFLFIINPVSGTRTKAGLESFLHSRSKLAALNYYIKHTTADLNTSQVKAWINELSATDLIACGGDGTVNVAANAVANTAVKLGIIPVGSGNGLARSAGIPLKPSQAFDLILLNTTIAVDAFIVNGKFACMLCGVGLDAAVAHSFASSIKRGLVTYIKQSIFQFAKAKPFAFRIAVGDCVFNTEAFFICIANSNQFGNNLTIAPVASLTDGLLDLIIVKRMPKLAMLFFVIKQVLGFNRVTTISTNLEKHPIIYLQTPQLTLQNLDAALLHIDGDPAETAPQIDVKILPGAINLLIK